MNCRFSIRFLVLAGAVGFAGVLRAGQAPVVTNQPQSQVATVGDNVNFSVAVAGTAPLSYQWRFNGANLSGATNTSLSLGNVQPSQAGAYSVRVSNSYGNAQSSTAQLTVNVPALITNQPVSKQTVAGADVTFLVGASGTSPLAYQWRYNGTPISGATMSTLTLTNVDIVNSGDYSVVVSNVAGADTSLTAQLDVTRKLRQMWVGRYNGSANAADTATATAVDAQGNVYVTGYAQESGNGLDFVTLKYSPSGALLWRNTYNGPADKDDQAQALVLDSAGNVYVTGASQSSFNGSDYATIKYDSNGTRLWVARYSGSDDDLPTALAVDTNGNVYVTGASKNSSGHFTALTIKYDHNGGQVWLSRYVGPGNSDDEAQALALDSTGNVYVTAKSKGNGTDFDYATIKYANNGAQLWANRYNGPANGADTPVQVAIDTLGNVLVTGASQGTTSGLDYATVKYASNGTQLWVARYDGPGHNDDRAAAVAVDEAGNAFVTGASKGAGGNFNYATVKYSSNGAQLWVQRYDGGGNIDNLATALVVDGSGNVYVTGGSGLTSSSSSSSGGGGLLGGLLGLLGGLLNGVLNILGLGNSPAQSDFVTIKYQGEDGTQNWVARYDGPAHDSDAPLAIALDSQHNVYVAGPSKGNGSDYDYAVIKYFQPQPPVITSQPGSQTVQAASTVLFSVVANGTAPLRYQWRLNGVNIPGATNATLTLSNVHPQDAGAYQVTVANDADAVDSAVANLTVVIPTLAFADNFADRIVVSTLSGLGRGNNVPATREPGEPKHAGKTGGKSVWLTWRAPASGIVTISTAGSSFDTLLAVYTGTSFTNLTLIASDDDSGGFLTSRVVFNAQVGVDYQIAIDGLNGASGDIVLSWDIEITTDRLPVITSMSDGKTVGLGEQVSFAVTVDQSPASFQWYLNGQALAGGQSASIIISNAQPTDVGLYYVRVMAGSREIYSQPAYLQINRTDDTVDRDAVAVNKLSDLMGLPPAGISNAQKLGMRRFASGPARGYSGTQIFNTYGGSSEPGEPTNCGMPGGASAWFAYQAQVSATLYINTDGSDFDTTLGVYIGNGYDFSSLRCVACDNNSGANGRTSAVRFQATEGTTYFISVDGVNGASGRVVLNYNLGDPPVIVAVPQNQRADVGSVLSFMVGVTGTVPLGCQWSFNGLRLVGATNISLTITNVQAANAGIYSVSLSNLVQVIQSPPARLDLNSTTLTITSQPVSQTVAEGASATFSVSATGDGNLTYQWHFNDAPIAGATSATLVLSTAGTNQAGNYSVKVTDANGPRLSASAALTISPLPVILQNPVSQTIAAGQALTLNAVAAGSPTLYYQWQLNHQNIADATNVSLTISNFQSANEGNYHLVVSNSFGLAISADASVMNGSVSRLFSGAKRSDNSFEFRMIGLPNTAYLIQASADLLEWQTLCSITSTNGFLDYLDTAAANADVRYYRAVLAP